MLITYKKNKRIVCYDPDNLAPGNKTKVEQRMHGSSLINRLELFCVLIKMH